MRFKDVLFLLWDSIKALFMDLVDLFGALKKAKTWSFILYATFILAVYYRNMTVIKIALPLIILLYIARRSNEPEYMRAYKDRAFLNDDEEVIGEYYEKYKRQCFFTNKEPLPYEEYKKEEIKKIQDRKCIESGQIDTEY